MSEDIRSLSETIQDAVAEWCRINDNSLMTNFVFAAEFMEEDGGSPSQVVIHPPRASVSSSLGLVLYAQNLLGEIQRRDVLEAIYGDEDDD